jgi:NADP-reducing hydrogenase subunit HndB
MLTFEKLEEMRHTALQAANLDQNRKGVRIVVGMATCGLAAGAQPVYDLLRQ